MSLNHDRDQPRDAKRLPVSFEPMYSGLQKVYWIDGQHINEDLSYTFNRDMPRAATMHIPKVVRFLHSFADDKDIGAEYCSAGVGDSECENKSWIFRDEEIGEFEYTATEPLLLPTPPYGWWDGRLSLEWAEPAEIGSEAFIYGSTGFDSHPDPDNPGSVIIDRTYYTKKQRWVYECIDPPEDGGGGGS